MTSNSDINTMATLRIISGAVSDLIAAQSRQRPAEPGREDGKVRPRLLTVEDSAIYIGRTKKAVQHLIASFKLRTVKSDRRVFLDRDDLDEWIRSYNEERPQQGRWCFGKTPTQTFLDTIPIAREKMIAA